MLYFNVADGGDWPVFSSAGQNIASQQTLNVNGQNWNVYLLLSFVGFFIYMF